MHHAHRTIAVAGTTLLVAAALVAPASAHSDSHKTWKVSPGTGTISKAVAKAKAGDTLELKKGTFYDSILIDKTLTIRGAGSSKTIIKPSASSMNPCNEGTSVLGFCVLGAVDAMFNPDFTKPVKNVKISDLRLTGFAEGVLAFNAKRLKVKDVRSDHNTGYGIAAFASTSSEFSENRTSWNGEAGLYMGDSPKARNVISKNKTDHNGIGIFMRDSTKLTATDNDAWGNCAGILALNSGHGAPWDLPAGDYKIVNNDVKGNNKACPRADDEPAFSGIGIALAGVHHVVVRDNEVKNNRSEAASDVPKGGIVVFKFGATKATDNTVTDNKVRHNKPVDIFWDGMGTGNRLKGNDCKKSMPTRLCSH